MIVLRFVCTLNTLAERDTVIAVKAYGLKSGGPVLRTGRIRSLKHVLFLPVD
jgi:hypothetical protein